MAWNLYTGTVYGNTAGTLVSFLDTSLVSAGWSIEASVGNIRRYIPGASAATYGKFAFVVDDSSTGSDATGYGVRADVGYSASTLLPNVGTDVSVHFCTRLTAPGSNLRLHKGSVTSPTVPVPEVQLYADNATFILSTAKTNSGISWSTYYVGEFYSYTPSDAYKACVLGPATTPVQFMMTGYTVRGPAATALTSFSGGVLSAQHGYGGGLAMGTSGNFMSQFALGTGLKRVDSSLANSNTTFAGAGSANYIGGPYRFPNPVDNGMVVSPVHVCQLTEGGGRRGVRGRLRGWYVPEHGHQFWTPVDGDTFSGSGDLAGKTFRLYKGTTNSAGGTLATYTAVESSTPETSS